MIRKAHHNDLDQVLRIYEEAKQFIKSYNSPQWQDGYPNLDTFYDDLSNERLHVFENNQKVVACASFYNDEKDYDVIYEGQWLTKSNNYMAVHTIAVLNSYLGRGIAKKFFDYIFNKYRVNSIRIDTHELNVPMMKMLEKNGFVYCGIIYLNNDKNHKRLAYERIR